MLMINFRKFTSKLGLFLFLMILVPAISQAHEVYVLSSEEISGLENNPPFSLLEIIYNNINETLIWAFLITFLIVSVFVISISATLENKFDKYLVRLKKYAPFIARVTVGLAFLTCAYHSALFGPELPFSTMFGDYDGIMQALFYILGTVMLLGVYSRIAGLIGLMIFIAGFVNHGIYMATYFNYLAEFFVLILVGGHKFALAHERPKWWNLSDILDYLANKYGEFSFLILRIGFGAGLIYSSVYAKVIHNQLALAVVNDFGLVDLFGFSAEFIVLGAAIIEILLGIFFILGIEIRFNAIMINVFLTLSLLYFGEAVWPHIILIGIPIAFFCYGYDKYSLEGYFFKKGNREPIF